MSFNHSACKVKSSQVAFNNESDKRTIVQ